MAKRTDEIAIYIRKPLPKAAIGMTMNDVDLPLSVLEGETIRLKNPPESFTLHVQY